jgi:tetratricopeptide (TPR) repeat protein
MPDSTWIHSGKPQAPDTTAKVLAWIKEHREAVIGSLIMLTVAVIIGLWVAMHYAGLRELAWKNLFIAQQTGYAGNPAEASKQLDSIEENYANTSACGFAALAKGDILFRQAKFTEAAGEYEKVVKKGPKNLLPFAIYNLGKAKEAAGDLQNAQTSYKDFLAAYPENFMAPEVHFSLAHTYELSNNASEAKAAYEKIMLLYPETYWAAEAKAKLNPEVKKAESGKK